MSGDVLSSAARALRDEAGDEGGADATRMRIVGTVRARRRRQSIVVRTAAVLLAAAIGGTAWAGATGHLSTFPPLQRLFGGEVRTGPVEPAGTASGSDSKGDVPAAPTEAAPKVSEAEEKRAEEGNPPREPKRTSVNRAAPVAPKPVSTVVSTENKAPAAENKAPATTGAVDDAAAESLYAKAHALHFQSQNYAAARAAWEAYLRAAPKGRYASFAHYNRAICLLRLGRRDEARRALQPFASGAFGGYRRAEAQSLLDAMDAK